MSGKIRVAIVGGDAETRRWQRLLQVVPHPSAVVAGVSVVESASGTQGSWRGAVAHPDVDAVLVCVSTESRADVATTALDAGKHVLVLPPMAADWNSAQQMAEAAWRSGVVLRSALPDRHRLAVARISAWIAEGAIGDPLILRCHFGSTASRASTLAPMETVDALMVRAIGLARWLLGSFDSVISLDLPKTDTATAIFRSSVDRAAFVQVSLADDPGEFLIEVAGRNGYVLAQGDGLGRERAVFGPRDATAPFRESVLEYLDPDTSGVREWDEFAEAIRAGSGVDNGTLEALESMRLYLAACRSAQTGMAEVVQTAP